jgi:hypothetical protein
MFVQRMSPEGRRNPALKEHASTGAKGERVRGGNAAFLKSTGIATGVVLIGGSAVPHFRLRVAQGQLRGDLLPSYWSMAAILIEGRHLFSIPIDATDGRASIPETNGIQLFELARFDDTECYPNIAVLDFPADLAELRGAIERLQFQRTRQAFPDALWRWQGHAWGVSAAANPISEGIGLPCAQFVASAYAELGVELLPGVAMGGACPESLWITALWWHTLYREEAAKSAHLQGHYRLLQPAAAALGYKDRLVGGAIVPGAQTSPLARGLKNAATSRR